MKFESLTFMDKNSMRGKLPNLGASVTIASPNEKTRAIKSNILTELISSRRFASFKGVISYLTSC
jgi:hypothetical protein